MSIMRIRALPLVLTLLGCPLLTGVASAGTLSLVDMFSHPWNYMAPLSDPDLGDADFNSTWMLSESAFAASYDGPSFELDTTTGPTIAQGGLGTAVFGHGLINFSPAETVIVSASTQTAYFRTTFTVPDLPLLAGSFVAEVLADDGAVFYIDGVRVDLHPLLTGLNCCDADGKTTPGPSVPDDYEVFARERGNENSTTLVPFPDMGPGTHTLAVSVHKVGPHDSDLGFALGLSAATASSTPIPEPSSSVLLLGCLSLLAAMCGRRTRQR